MSHDDQPTCGKGLAENSILPATLGKLLTAMTENLEIHMKALDLTDQNSQSEYNAYEELVKEFRQIAAQLYVAADHMAGYRDLPMGRHDEQAMAHPSVRETFEAFVKQKQELMSLLEQTAERDNNLLEMMRRHVNRSK
jgi:hypothetical protein